MRFCLDAIETIRQIYYDDFGSKALLALVNMHFLVSTFQLSFGPSK